ncbi:MAG: hypothetical protein WDN06_11825, partial [Asticcacaulis sp.]
ARLDLADIGFVDEDFGLELGQVAGDDEQGRRRERGGDGLALFDLAVDDDTVDRRQDFGAVEVELLRTERRLRLGDIGRRGVDGRLGLGDRGQRRLLRRRVDVERGLRQEALVEQALVAVPGGLGLVEPGLGGLEVGFLLAEIGLLRVQAGGRLVDAGLEGRGSILASNWPFFTRVVEIGIDAADQTDSCEPTLTVSRASKVPEAETVLVTSPRSTVPKR